MKRLFRIFELSKSEQRAVLIVILILIAAAFIGYQHRVHQHPGQATPAAGVQPSLSPVKIEEKE
jgi:hypothetical protein